MQYRALIFDFDYTLGDATESIYAGFCHAFGAMGLPQPTLEAVRLTIGLPAVDGFSSLSGDWTEESRSRFFQLFAPVSHEQQAAGRVKLFPGAVELLSLLRSRGIRTAVVSSKSLDSVRAVLAATGVSDSFDFLVGGGLVPTFKPDPEGVELAIRTLGVEHSAVLYCGDTVIDAQTAQNAGVDFCAVLNGTTPEEAFVPYPHVYAARDLPALERWLTEGGRI